MELLEKFGIGLLIIVVTVAIIIIYCVNRILVNKKVYDNLCESLNELEKDCQNTDMYIMANRKYLKYKGRYDQPADVGIQSIIEEVVSELEVEGVHVLEHNKQIKNASSNCILAGVLGTFIGLTFVLLGMKEVNQTSINQAMGGMSTAFVTSIFGVSSSIILSFILSKMNTENKLLSIMLKLENIITSKDSTDKNEAFNQKINELKESIESISHSIKSIERFDQITTKLNKFNNGFIQTINELDDLLKSSKSSISQFEKNIGKLENQFNILNGKFNRLFGVYDNISESNEVVLESMNDVRENIKTSAENQVLINEKTSEMLSEFKKYEMNTREIIDNLSEKENKLFESISSLNTNILYQTNNLDEQKEALNKLSESVRAQMVLMDEQTEALDTNLGQSLERSLGQFERYVQTTNKIIENKLEILFKYVAMQDELARDLEV